ncbi:TPA: hypothetical protein I6201_003408 [Vibrio cholerae]|uniref:hypothetical protein n=1 Tax=Vibrio sp. B1FLJ16 TaxID=2751178 RepID=UPI0015F49F6A|nr:hypothetical protein [Vibrio sp. B1FLJ16]CAD7813590.1 hypothetical protein ACOMICROBIO_EPCKBFOG_02697 [Vibrio sp. B1FLJ16]CAE6921789.1 hypothetical protein ACOMICROBIO_EPCKBFOG_02697 [Vibrio sp. B1FLJ16]HAS3641986.1 hypothetical protein [Vibrio cholerae]
MQGRIKQSEQKIKKLSEDLRKQLLFMSMMEKPTKAAKDKLYKIEGQLSAEVCELVRLSYEIALMYEEMITSPDIAIRLEAQKLKSYLLDLSYHNEKYEKIAKKMKYGSIKYK